MGQTGLVFNFPGNIHPSLASVAPGVEIGPLFFRKWLSVRLFVQQLAYIKRVLS